MRWGLEERDGRAVDAADDRLGTSNPFQHASPAQGDADDRRKLRQKAEDEAKRKRREERQDQVLGEAAELAQLVSAAAQAGEGWAGIGAVETSGQRQRQPAAAQGGRAVFRSTEAWWLWAWRSRLPAKADQQHGSMSVARACSGSSAARAVFAPPCACCRASPPSASSRSCAARGWRWTRQQVSPPGAAGGAGGAGHARQRRRASSTSAPSCRTPLLPAQPLSLP